MKVVVDGLKNINDHSLATDLLTDLALTAQFEKTVFNVHFGISR